MSDEELFARWRSVRSGVARVQGRLDQIVEESGVPAQWFAVLNLLLGAEGLRLPMNVLAGELSMTSGGFTKLADRMAREGLIDRRGSSQDRRVVYAALTDDGQLMARRAVAGYAGELRACVLGVVTSEEFTAAAVTMRALNSVHVALAEVQVPDGSLPTRRSSALPERRRRKPVGD